MELEKVGKLDLNEEPYLQPISNRGIGFIISIKILLNFNL